MELFFFHSQINSVLLMCFKCALNVSFFMQSLHIQKQLLSTNSTAAGYFSSTKKSSISAYKNIGF
jgi:hypothetical protein